jgi:FecR-like protein
MKKKLLVSMLMLGLLLTFASGNLFSEGEANLDYGHISFVDKAATVVHQDKTKHKAVVNLPVAPGDQIITGDDGRCEIQFDNGTIIRLDKNTRLRVTTIMAPTLTTKWKVTTLHLMRGQLYSMIQSYNREMFQIITPNAAFDLKKRSASTIRINDNGNTFIYVDKGKMDVMFGIDINSVKTDVIKSKIACTISSDHKISRTEETKDLEFVGWNEYVNRNFKDLHYGLSKVPKKIYRQNKGLVYWAERWSNLFGEWVYDGIFGYVWKPADEIFAFSKRPFFHANYVRVNGELILVPSQPWGWAPAHMGTWVWMKWGWTWVPGSAFSTGIAQYQSNFYFNTMDYWINQIYGNYHLYYTYRRFGYARWRDDYTRYYKKPAPRKPSLKDVPTSVRTLITKMNKAKVDKLKAKFGNNRPDAMISKDKLARFFKDGKISKKTGKKMVLANSARETISRKNAKDILSRPYQGKIRDKKGTSRHMIEKSKHAISRIPKMKQRGFRDFNPDLRWAISKGYTVNYSSKTNAVVCPNLKVNSRTIPKNMRAKLRHRGIRGSKRGRSGGGSYYSSTSSSSSSSTSSSGSTTSSKSSTGSKSGGSKSNVTGSKKN